MDGNHVSVGEVRVYPSGDCSDLFAVYINISILQICGWKNQCGKSEGTVFFFNVPLGAPYIPTNKDEKNNYAEIEIEVMYTYQNMCQKQSVCDPSEIYPEHSWREGWFYRPHRRQQLLISYSWLLSKK